MKVTREIRKRIFNDSMTFLRTTYCGNWYNLVLLLEDVFFHWLSDWLSPRFFINPPAFYLGEVVEVAVTFSTLRGRATPPTPPPCKGGYMTPPTTRIQGPSGTHIPHGFPYKLPPVSFSCRFPASFLQAFCQHGALKFFTRLRMVQPNNNTKTLPTTNLLLPIPKYKAKGGR